MATELFNILIYLLIIGVILALIYYVVDALGVPEPFGRLIKVVAVVIAALILIFLLLGLVGVPA